MLKAYFTDSNSIKQHGSNIFGNGPKTSKYAIFGLNGQFRPKIAYFDVFGPFPKMFDPCCYIPLKSVIFFGFFEMKKIKKLKKIFFCSSVINWNRSCATTQTIRMITGTSNFLWQLIWPKGTRKSCFPYQNKKVVFQTALLTLSYRQWKYAVRPKWPRYCQKCLVLAVLPVK